MNRVVRTMKLLLPLCSPRMILETTLIIQLCIFMTFCLKIISPLVRSEQFIHKAKSVFSPSMLYFQPYDRLEAWLTDDSQDLIEVKKRRTKFDHQISALFPGCEIGRMYVVNGETHHGMEIQVAAFSSNLLKDMGFRDFGNVEEGIIPTWYRGRSDIQKQNMTVNLYTYHQQSIDVQVAGRISLNTLLVLPKYGSTLPTISQLLAKNSYESFTAADPDAMLITDLNYLPESVSMFSSSCLIISPRQPVDITPALRQKVNAIGGQIISYKELIENSYQRNLQENQIPLARFIASAVFTMVSLTGYVFLGYIRNRRILGIYATNGMSTSQVKRLYLQFVGFLFLLALIAEILLLVILSGAGMLRLNDVSARVIVFTALGYLVIVLFTVLLVKQKLANFEIAKIVREVEG